MSTQLDSEAGCIARRPFLRALAAGGTAAAVGGAGLRTQSQEAQAVAPAVIYGIGVAGGATVGWALRETEILGSDDPPEGLTADALKNRIYTAARTRQSNNRSTFIDNQNIIDNMDHAAFSEARLAAIDELNTGSSQSEVTDSALEAMEEHVSVIEKNLIESWNETILELQNLFDAATSHPDLSTPESITPYEDPILDQTNVTESFNDPLYATNSHELPNGDVMDLHQMRLGEPDSAYGDTAPIYDLITIERDPESSSYYGPDGHFFEIETEEGTVKYLDYEDWNPVYNQLNDTVSQLTSDITLWVENVYDEVEAGDIDTSDLLTPQDHAELMADGETHSQAVADLIALNIPTDFEREATVHIPSSDATLYGNLAVTDEEMTIETGIEYDPETDFDGSVFLTYDMAAGQARWTDYVTSISSGDVTFTSEPVPESLYRITTQSGQTVEVTSVDLMNQGDGTYVADVSETVTEADIDEVMVYSESDETYYETIQLTEPFEVESFEDSEGNTYDTGDFERPTTPHSDDNYITQEEWEDMLDRQDELIQQYEDAQNGGWGGLPSFDDLQGNYLAGAVIAFLAIFGIAKASN